jgi:beta-xylosidase
MKKKTIGRLLLWTLIVFAGNGSLDATSRSLEKPVDDPGQPARLAAEFLAPGPSSGPAGQAACRSTVWSPETTPTTYTNPVLYADYSDPDVIRVGRDYYMTASSFSCLPGLPVLHSRDLVNWRLIGHALRRYPNPAFDRPQHGKGVWAPSLRYHDNRYYIFWGDPDAGIYRLCADHPAGPWDAPRLVLAGVGMIDPCPLWDDDGKAYLIHAWAASRVGVKGLLTVREMDPAGTFVSPEGKHVFDGNDHQPTIEGPKFYKRDGFYYILAPAGGVRNGWQLALRARDIYGPYTHRVVLEQGSSPINGPHQGGWVESTDGRSWFLHFQDAGAYGRLVHLQPVGWQDGWPWMGRRDDRSGAWQPVPTGTKPECGPDLPGVNPAETDEFDHDELGRQWQWQANPKLTWFALMRDRDYLRLFAEALPHDQATLWDAGNLLLQKFPAPAFTATTKLTFTPRENGPQAGLVVMGKDYACLTVTRTDEGFTLSQRVCQNAANGGTETVRATTALPDATVSLRVTVSGPPALCQFSYSLDGDRFDPLGEPFPAKPGLWVGAKVGLFCIRPPTIANGGYADFDWFRIEPPPHD